MKIHTLKIVAISLVLLSSQALFAQAKNRLEVRGDRWEMPLQRQEMEDSRWEMEVEAQGCSFQEIEGSVINGIEYKDVDNQSSLLANNSVPISHLPSSISYLGITPKLMMNPSLEAGTKSLTEALGILEKRAIIEEGSVVKVDSIPSNSSNQVLRLRGGGPKKSQPMGELKATGDTSTEKESARDDADLDSASSDEEDAHHEILNDSSLTAFDQEDSSVNMIYERVLWWKANKTVGGTKKEADRFAEGIPEFLLRIKRYKELLKELETKQIKIKGKASKVCVAEKKDETNYWNHIAHAFDLAVEKLKKAIEAEFVDNEELARIWCEAAKQQAYSAEYYVQAVNAWLNGSDFDYEYFDKISDTAKYSSQRFEEVAVALEKAIKAQEANQIDISDLWYKVAKGYEESAEYKQQAVKAKAIRNDVDFNRLDNAGNSARVSARILEQQADELEASTAQNIMEKEATTISSKKAAETMRKSQEARSKTQTMLGTSTDAWRGTANSLEKTSKYWTKEDQAEGEGKATLAAGYREAAAITQRSADKYQAIVERGVKGVSKEEIFGWEGGLSLQKQADYQVKAIEAEEAGKAQLATTYREAAALSEKAAEQYEQAAQAFDEGKKSESIQVLNTGKATQKEADAMVAKISGKPEMAKKYCEIAEQQAHAV